MNTSDATLLDQFAKERDEAAFAELARRHGGLIFHTALRCTGNHALAADISQKVLCVLARKAAQLVLSLGERGLAPWLHRATTLEASKVLRAEASHRRRSQLQHPDDMPATTMGSSFWEDALPHLDPALDQLGEKDRSVLILHFFRSLTFREIAATTGRSADAVQKQSIRALEKLSRLLRSRGVVLPVVALAAGLTAESAKAAPAALISSFATHAAAKATLPANPILVMISTKTKILVPIVLIVCLIPLIVQRTLISRQEDHLAALQHTLDVASGSPRVSAVTRQRATRLSKSSSTLISDKRDWQTLMAESAMDLSPADKAALRAKIESMPPADIASVMKEAAVSDGPQNSKVEFLRYITNILGESDPGLAFTTLVGSLKVDMWTFNHMHASDAYQSWLERDRAAVLAWFQSMEEEKRKGEWIPQNFVKDFQLPLLQELVRSDSEAARAMISRETSSDSRQALMRSAVLEYASGHNDDANDGNVMEAATYLQYIRQLPATTDGDEKPLIETVAHRMAKGGRIKDLQSLFATPELTAGERQAIGTMVASVCAASPEQAPALTSLLKGVMPEDADRLIGEQRTLQPTPK